MLESCPMLLVVGENHFTSHLFILNHDMEIIGFETTVLGSDDSVPQFNTHLLLVKTLELENPNQSIHLSSASQRRY
jgi:hypothetical protein